MSLGKQAMAAAGLALVAGLGACASAPPPRGADGGRSITDSVLRPRAEALLLVWFDLNRDGAVTQAEIGEAAGAGFTAADTNRDGALGGIELRAWGLALGGNPVAAPLLAAVDGDGDGAVTVDEFTRYFTMTFNGLDADQDMIVARAELFEELAPPARARTQVLQVP